ncbi:MAG: HAD family hydrolase [Nitrospirae bacterium]|nr:HAD family hydrolase [Nitrospirota bacterium]
MRPTTIGLDFVETLYSVDTQNLPEVEFGGRPFRSTIPLTFELVRAQARDLTLDRYCQAVFEAYRDAEVEREATSREILSDDIYRKIVRSVLPAGTAEDLALEVGRLHRTHLATALVLPREHVAMLKQLRERFALGVISNFDSTSVVETVLRRDGIADLFAAVVISAEVGWRKPHARIFQTFTDRLGVEPSEVLFVGDHYRYDVVGARKAGMQAVWLGKSGDHGMPPESDRASTLAALTELPAYIDSLS